ncbi:unnamed protein product [Effrenium voratum]|uniref:Uncharacterized protein n=1 Tax=Effrenium voratum TaxID=2562239 RepID=A0AA36IKV5_9DINO|nr:unnamed protein product [Effrenium voratum]
MLGAYGSLTLKPVVPWGTAPWLGELHRVLCPVKRHALQRIKSFLKIETVRRYTDSKGKSRIAGSLHLKQTQAYPGQLGLTATCHKESLDVGLMLTVEQHCGCLSWFSTLLLLKLVWLKSF